MFPGPGNIFDHIPVLLYHNTIQYNTIQYNTKTGEKNFNTKVHDDKTYEPKTKSKNDKQITSFALSIKNYIDNSDV